MTRGSMRRGPTRANAHHLLLHLPPQALPSIQIPVSPHIFTSISWATATSTLPSLSPVSPHPFSLSLWEFPGSLLAVDILSLIPHGPQCPRRCGAGRSASVNPNLPHRCSSPT